MTTQRLVQAVQAALAEREEKVRESEATAARRASEHVEGLRLLEEQMAKSLEDREQRLKLAVSAAWKPHTEPAVEPQICCDIPVTFAVSALRRPRPGLRRSCQLHLQILEPLERLNTILFFIFKGWRVGKSRVSIMVTLEPQASTAGLVFRTLY